MRGMGGWAVMGGGVVLLPPAAALPKSERLLYSG